jgi:hypothetical protein
MQEVESQTVFISVPAWASRAGVSRWKAYDLVKKHLIPHVILGGIILIPASTIDKLVERAFENVA